MGTRSVSKPKASFPHSLRLAKQPACTRAARQHSPGDTGELVRHGNNDDDVLVCPGVQSIEPGSNGDAFALDPQHRRSRPVDQDFAQVAVASLADTEQLRLATGRVLPWHDAEPGGELPALCETLRRCQLPQQWLSR